FDTPDEEARQDSGVQNGGSGPTTRLIELTPRLWDDASYGQLSSDGQRVFVLWDLGYAKSNISSNVLIRPGGIQTRPPGAPKPYNRLASLDLKTQGSLQWIVGGVDGEDEPRLAGAFFLGPPLPLNGQLYVLAEVKGEIRLVVLDTRTGQLRWTQQLAHVDTRTITLDSTRRLAGATPSFSDGVLVCPTSAGAVVAVDISTRSLLWGYQYQQQAPVNPRFGFRPSTTRSKKRNGERWADASVTIAQGKVLVTPVEGDDLICLDLLTGKSSWPTQKRDERLYVACVHQGKVVMVGKESITAFTLADGKPAWSEPITLKKGMPSGRGFQSDDFYYLPTTGKQLLKIDLSKGEILQEITTSTVLGNLVCYRDEVISQTPRNLETYLQAARLREKVAARLEKDPQDSWALARRCELLLQDGKRLEALDSLRKCYQLDPTDIAMRSLLIDTILDLLREDFTTHQGLIAEARDLVEQPAERESFLQLLAMGLQNSGDLEGSFQTYMSLWTLDLQSSATPQDERPLEKVSEDLHVRRDRWIQARIMQLLTKAEPAQRAKMEKTIQAHYDEAVASAKTQPLRNFIGFFGSHTLAEQAQLQLASQLIHADQIIDRELLEAELYLVRLKRSANESVVAGATARLARLLKLARRYDEAVPYYIELATRWPDTVVIDDQTGQQLRDQAAQTPELKDLLAAAPRW
ncbi:MAG: PQQ-binding-like beta-propeller repeat protein, partial [Planctomycetota bacterium]|nr:PQQ-binding-like beta-propeller repeat protein [Planctomycetota bacterium]